MMANQQSNYQLTPIARHSGRQFSEVARFPPTGNAAPHGLRRQSEVYCNVRHMLSYIDQVESENFRHSKAIDDQFQAIKQELYAALRGESTMRSSSVALLSDRQWAPLIEEMERDLQRNQMASSGIGRNLAQLKAAIKEMKKGGKGVAATTPNTQTASYLLDRDCQLSLQYRTPMTDPIVHNSSSFSDGHSIQMPRKGASSSPTSNTDADAGLFKIPFPPGSTPPLRSSITSNSSMSTPLLSVKADDSDRFRNVVLGLPQVDPLKATMSAEQYRLHIEESLSWIDRHWHIIVQQRK